MTPDPPTLPMLADVRAAADRIAGHVVHTPVIRNADLDAIAGAELWMKAENLQRIGAFKARGAMHAVGRLSEAERARGVITFSSGNHAQAVALAAKTFAIPATIVMPTDAPAIKVAGVRRLGGEVIFAGTTSDERRAVALQHAERTGAAVIQPFDHPDIIAGAGTATLELHEAVAAATGGESLDALVVPVGGGGLIAGACVASEAVATKIYAVEPRGCDAMAQSLAAGQRVAVAPGPTLADGLKPVMIGELNYAIAKHRLAGALHVDDDAIATALVRLLVFAKLLVEPSGAAALAAALAGDVPGRPRRIGVILSGGNVEPALVADLVTRYSDRCSA